MKSPKETALEEKVLRQLAGHPFSEELARVLFADEETQHIQEYACQSAASDSTITVPSTCGKSPTTRSRLSSFSMGRG